MADLIIYSFQLNLKIILQVQVIFLLLMSATNCWDYWQERVPWAALPSSLEEQFSPQIDWDFTRTVRPPARMGKQGNIVLHHLSRSSLQPLQTENFI